MKTEAELLALLGDPETDKEQVIKDVIASVKEVFASNQQMKDASDQSADTAADAIERLNTANKTIMDLTEALKNIWRVLGANRPEEINEMKTLLAKWILAPSTIKLGVMLNESKSE